MLSVECLIRLNQIFFFFLYIFVSFWIFFTSSLWTVYFGLELQWMLLTILIIIGSPVWRGLLNYLMLNGMISIWLIIGILFSNLLFFLFGCLAKVGYFPFCLLLSYQYYLCGYNWIVFDLLNKISYFNAFIITIHFCTLIIANFGLIFVLVNFMIIMFFVKFVLCIKHVIFISSLQWYLLILCCVYFQDELFSFYFLILYSITTIFILWDCDIYLWAKCVERVKLCAKLSVEHAKQTKRVKLIKLNTTRLKCPFFLTDNVKQWIFISSLLLIIYWMTIFSFFPTMMFLLKFIFLFLFINHALGWAFSFVIFLVFIFQGFYIRSIGMLLGVLDWLVC